MANETATLAAYVANLKFDGYPAARCWSAPRC